MANYCFVVPVLPGGVKLMQDWNAQMIKNNKEHDAVFQTAGISREQVWIQRTPQGELAVVSFEVKDPAKAFETLATSPHPWAVKFREFLTKASGADFTQPVSLNEQVANWQAT
jgi:hypothetical protein